MSNNSKSARLQLSTQELLDLMQGEIEVDTATGSPLVDAYGRRSNISYFASGNLRDSLKTAGNAGAKAVIWSHT